MHSCDTPKTVLPAPNPPKIRPFAMQNVKACRKYIVRNILTFLHIPARHRSTARLVVKKTFSDPKSRVFLHNTLAINYTQASSERSTPYPLRIPSVSPPCPVRQKTDKRRRKQGVDRAGSRLLSDASLTTQLIIRSGPNASPQFLPPAGSPAATFILPVLK